jgi:hypothetical protein
MRNIPTALLLLALASSCAPMPPSAPHPLLEQSIHWPALGRICGTNDKNCQSQSDAAFNVDQRSRLVEFWSPNCPPCRERLTELSRRHREFEAMGWSVVLVAVLEPDESESLALDTLHRWKAFESSWTLAQSASTQIGVHGLPSVWLVSAQQRLRWVAPARATIDDVIVAAKRVR